MKINPLPEDDEMHLEELTHRLGNELKELDVEKVEVAKSGKAPEGTKGIPDVPVWGSLLVTLATSSGVIPALVGTVQSWLKRHENRSVTMEIRGDKLQVTGISSAQQHELINNWLKVHGANMNKDG